MVNKVEAEKFKTVGNNHFKNGSYAPAIEQYKLAIEQDPNNPAYWYVARSLLCFVSSFMVYPLPARHNTHSLFPSFPTVNDFFLLECVFTLHLFFFKGRIWPPATKN